MTLNQFVPFGLFNGVNNFELRSSLTKLIPRARLPFGSTTEGESTSPPAAGAPLPLLLAAPVAAGGKRLFSTSIFKWLVVVFLPRIAAGLVAASSTLLVS